MNDALTLQLRVPGTSLPAFGCHQGIGCDYARSQYNKLEKLDELCVGCFF